jgi:flagellin
LAVQASNDTYTASDRQNVQTEINQLVAEIDRISNQTDFNTKKLLDGSAGGAQVFGGGPDIKGIVAMAGVAIATSMSISIASAATRSAFEGASAAGSFFTQTSTVTIQGGLGTQTFTAQAGESLETFFQVVDASGIGVTMNIDANSGVVEIVNNNFGLNTTVNGALSGGPTAVSVLGATGDFATSGLCMQLMTGKQGSVATTGKFVSGQAASNAAITLGGSGWTQIITATGINSDQIVGAGTSAGIVITLSDPSNLSVTGGDIINVQQNAGGSLKFQVGANAGQTIGLALDAVNSQALGVTSLDVLTQSDAETAITQLDRAIQQVSTARSTMGAVINRLTNSVNNDQSAQENALAAESRIRDVNVAQETVQFTRDQILLQAGTAVLAQANQASASVLALLR